jgi:5-methylcytosine-specific restriction endonuclease McrA
MRRFRFEGGLGKAYDYGKSIQHARPGSWGRRAKAFKAVHVQCAKCGAIAELECDHIVPLHKGGSDEWSNLQSLCRQCHAIKTATEQGKDCGKKIAQFRDPIG